MTGLIVLAVILAALVVLSLTTNVLDAVLAVAFVVGVFVFRWLRNRKKKE